ncbi:PepSY-associated TM helix domain-containing protein [Fulvivirga lutimaris]|uniref:PepSY-associated TM helix domain-containing protein n=1 Tax=Fulvivirga lutimaris TaxID=1819566 RepID=UPI0012BCB8C7|nr:PepSY-associated TM helix domain-containing protein [Fulvivirga lutimaris]MTI41205.1 PepSY domain-containing protein [Fulvivirga lutimaris]
MKKVIGTLHLTLGLLSGLVVLIVSITGCIYVFEEELKSWLYKDRITIEVPIQASKKPLTELFEIAQQAAGNDHPIQSVTVPTKANKTYEFRPEQIRDNTAYTHFGEIAYYHKFYLNPYTGDVVMDENTTLEFFYVVLRLHRNLLLNRKVGKMTVGVSVIIFVLLLISGLILWWPKNKKAAKQRYAFRWKTSTKWKRKNYDLHNILGFYSMIILFIIACTGLVFSYKWFGDGVQWLVNGGSLPPKSERLYSDTTKVATLLPLDKILYSANQLNAEAKAFSINLPDKITDVVSVTVQNSEKRYKRERHLFDQHTGQLLNTASFDDKTTGEKLRAMNYDIHVGNILGLPGKILAFIASLISASLPITGFMICIGRKKMRKLKTVS